MIGKEKDITQGDDGPQTGEQGPFVQAEDGKEQGGDEYDTRLTPTVEGV